MQQAGGADCRRGLRSARVALSKIENKIIVKGVAVVAVEMRQKSCEGSGLDFVVLRSIFVE